MRIVGELLKPECKITIFSWNSKYLIKFERGPYEQTYKVPETDVTGDKAALKIANDEVFLKEVLGRFQEMHASCTDSLARL